MTETGGHPGDALQLLLDERLPPDRRAAVEAHVQACARCRRELDGLRGLKMLLRQASPQHSVPPELFERVATALTRDRETSALPSRRVPVSRRAAVIGLSLAAAAAVVVIVLVRLAPADVVARVARDLERYRADRLALELETDDPAALERFFGQARTPLTVRVWDFGMMGYRLRGGRVHDVVGRVSALFAYEGPGGRNLVCQMYVGALSELPPGGEERQHRGIQFRIYRTNGVTLVFWEEGDLVCVLAADVDPEEAVSLAYAKAQRA